MDQVPLPCVQVLDFASRRLEQLLLDRGYQTEAVRAVMQESNRDPARVQAAVQQLQVSLASCFGTERADHTCRQATPAVQMTELPPCHVWPAVDTASGIICSAERAAFIICSLSGQGMSGMLLSLDPGAVLSSLSSSPCSNI